MKTITFTLTVAVALLIAACNTSKKSTTSTTSAAPVTNPAVTTTPATVTAAKSSNGIYEPGKEELAALQLKYADATLDRLKEGYVIYAYGPCVSCHGAKSIYKYDEPRWEKIIDDMAKMANLSASQKDAVYKYVLAIKATQPK